MDMKRDRKASVTPVVLIADNFRISPTKRKYRYCEDGALFLLEGVIKTKEDVEKIVSFISVAVKDPTFQVGNVTYIKSGGNSLYTNSAIVKRDFDCLLDLPEGYDDCYIKD